MKQIKCHHILLYIRPGNLLICINFYRNTTTLFLNILFYLNFAAYNLILIRFCRIKITIIIATIKITNIVCYIISNILTLQGKRFCFNLEFMPFKHLWEPLTINYQQVAVDDFSFPQKTGVWSLAKMEFESACQRRRFRRCGFDPWVWKISLE